MWVAAWSASIFRWTYASSRPSGHIPVTPSMPCMVATSSMPTPLRMTRRELLVEAPDAVTKCDYHQHERTGVTYHLAVLLLDGTKVLERGQIHPSLLDCRYASVVLERNDPFALLVTPRSAFPLALDGQSSGRGTGRDGLGWCLEFEQGGVAAC